MIRYVIYRSFELSSIKNRIFYKWYVYFSSGTSKTSKASYKSLYFITRHCQKKMNKMRKLLHPLAFPLTTGSWHALNHKRRWLSCMALNSLQIRWKQSEVWRLLSCKSWNDVMLNNLSNGSNEEKWMKK